MTSFRALPAVLLGSLLLLACDESTTCCNCMSARGESRHEAGALADPIDCKKTCETESGGKEFIASACDASESPEGYLTAGVSSDGVEPTLTFEKEGASTRKTVKTNVLKDARGQIVSFDEQDDFAPSGNLYFLSFTIARTATGQVSAYTAKVTARIGDATVAGKLNYP